MNSVPFGFIVRGGTDRPRRLCDWQKAFNACAVCDPAAPVGVEGYLSMFSFPQGIRAHLDEHGSPRGYVGPTGGPYIWLDLDGPGALDDTRKICSWLDVLDDSIGALVFFSGNKGYHVGIPSAALGAEPGATFNLAARAFVETLASNVGATSLDCSVYDRVRILRAPNSRHPKSGLHKVALQMDSMLRISEARVFELAREPYPFEVPQAGGVNVDLAKRWADACAKAAQVDVRRSEHRVAAVSGGTRLRASTLAYIREGATDGERATLLFQAAANLAECGASARLVWGLLEESALDSGLPPSEVRRQIACGVTHGGCGHE